VIIMAISESDILFRHQLLKHPGPPLRLTRLGSAEIIAHCGLIDKLCIEANEKRLTDGQMGECYNRFFDSCRWN